MLPADHAFPVGGVVFGFPPVRVYVFDTGAVREREHPSPLGGLDELIVDEVVVVALMQHQAGLVDGSVVHNVGAGDEGMG